MTSDAPRTMTGGCQCRRVRYRVEVADDAAYLCHCGMCRRATGGVSAALTQVSQAAVTWDNGPPDFYRSSPIAERPFCSACGTPLGFRYVDSDKMDLTVGSFDEPGWFRPTTNFSDETRLEAWSDTSHLPAMRLDTYAPLVEKWARAGGERPA